MRIVVISDTHGRHNALGRLHGDVLLHCGDVESLFSAESQTLEDIDNWFGAQRFDRIFCIGGNHDLLLEQKLKTTNSPFRNATWLHERAETYKGVTFYGASWVPELKRHAFFADPENLESAWARIPDETDALITHTPPRGVLDRSSRGRVLGCPHLARRVRDVAPQLHCFGHVHASVGHVTRNGTVFVNATSVNSNFEIAHPPFVYDLPGQLIL